MLIETNEISAMKKTLEGAVRLPPIADTSQSERRIRAVSLEYSWLFLNLPGGNRRQPLTRGALLLRTFPGQHHAVTHRQADILHSRIRLNQLIERDYRVIIDTLRIEHPAAP
jgi:hypothetical protein